MAVSDDLQNRIVSDGVVRRMQQLLTAVTETEEQTLQLNALACLTEALRDKDSEVTTLVAEGGREAKADWTEGDSWVALCFGRNHPTQQRGCSCRPPLGIYSWSA